MDAKTFEYKDPYFLNRLVMLISGERCDFSATLRPDIPEFIQAAECARAFSASSPDFPDLDKQLREKQLSRDQKHALVMMAMCEKHGVMPFWNLRFDYSYRQFDEPKIKYVGYNFGCTVHDEPYLTCVHPIQFTKGSKWYSITFEEVAGKENTNRAKLAISRFTEQGYLVVGIYAHLDPYIRSGDHYCDYKESKSQMHARDGKVTFWGEVPEGFDLSGLDIIKAEQMRRQLPEPKLLEKLVDSIGGTSSISKQ
ncbi:hypothetical protein JW826_04135 [Candidatus Woesearchaeota archaeon]|nr:hypothetical protein [Candidatus Woesearchaeota archaeon]